MSQTVDDEVRRVAVVRLSAKLHSCQCLVDAAGKAKVSGSVSPLSTWMS